VATEVGVAWCARIGLAEPVPKPISTLATSVRIDQGIRSEVSGEQGRGQVRLSITLGTVQAVVGPGSRESRRRPSR